MKKQLKKYTIEQILKAGEIGEVSMIDLNHVVSLLDEAQEILENKKVLKKSRLKKFKFPKNGEITTEMGDVMLNKLLEKYDTTIEQIKNTDGKTLNGEYWLDYIILTEAEFNIWREWCRAFLKERCVPVYSDEWITSKFSYWSLLYAFDVV